MLRVLAHSGPRANFLLALRRVETTLVYSNQHDLAFMHVVPEMPRIIAAMLAKPNVNYVAFARAGHYLGDYFQDSVLEDVAGVQLRRIGGYSDADHLARTAYYRERIEPYVAASAPFYIEDVVHPTVWACSPHSSGDCSVFRYHSAEARGRCLALRENCSHDAEAKALAEGLFRVEGFPMSHLNGESMDGDVDQGFGAAGADLPEWEVRPIARRSQNWAADQLISDTFDCAGAITLRGASAGTSGGNLPLGRAALRR